MYEYTRNLSTATAHRGMPDYTGWNIGSFAPVDWSTPAAEETDEQRRGFDSCPW
jgi:hypothetical protein